MRKKSFSKKSINNSTVTKICCWQGCTNEGNYPAPKSPLDLISRYDFCLEHVREYNKNWDFFRDMPAEDVERYHIETIYGHRPTFSTGIKYNQNLADRVIHKLYDFMDWQQESNKRSNQNFDIETTVTSAERQALSILNVKLPTNLKEIKIQYKKLVKKYHPDICGKDGEEKIKQINQAYSLLKEKYV